MERCSAIQHNLKHDTWQAFRDIKALTTKRPPATNRLLRPDGTVATAESEVNELWQRHWEHHFAATTSYNNSYYNHNLPQHHQPCSTTPPITTQQDVEYLIKHLTPRKASPNVAHTDLWRLCSDVLAPPLTTIINTITSHAGVDNAMS
eukprot:6472770-Amphidinium_carterae.1